MSNLKRFRVVWDGDKYPFESDSLEDVFFQYLFFLDDRIREMKIECLVDNIVVSAIDVYDSFCEGECPGDLQFF